MRTLAGRTAKAAAVTCCALALLAPACRKRRPPPKPPAAKPAVKSESRSIEGKWLGVLHGSGRDPRSKYEYEVGLKLTRERGTGELEGTLAVLDCREGSRSGDHLGEPFALERVTHYGKRVILRVSLPLTATDDKLVFRLTYDGDRMTGSADHSSKVTNVSFHTVTFTRVD